MCGIFGVFQSNLTLSPFCFRKISELLFKGVETRGKEASGIAFLSPFLSQDEVHVVKSMYNVTRLQKNIQYRNLLDKHFPKKEGQYASGCFFIGHARLVTNGSELNDQNNQPVIKGNSILAHNGIIVNAKNLWSQHQDIKPTSELDSEIIAALIEKYRSANHSPVFSVCKTFSEIVGMASIVTVFLDLELLMLASNNGSLYYLADDEDNFVAFASEKYSFKKFLNMSSANKLFSGYKIHQVDPGFGVAISTVNGKLFKFNLADYTCDLPSYFYNARKKLSIKQTHIGAANMNNLCQSAVQLKSNTYTKLELEYRKIKESVDKLKRCVKCVLPETVPFISFNQSGVCNFCENYIKNQLLGRNQLELELNKYRRKANEVECVMAFSGGRDSSYGLHYIVKELGLKTITYTYDWGVITDLARRNISRMCSKLGIENILISADIRLKRKNIRKNVLAWLKQPHLGMIPLFMAGDKQFIWYSQQVKRQNNVDLDIFTFNLLEKTQFKEEYSGIQLWKPGADANKFGEQLAFLNRFKLGAFYLKQFLSNPAYLNLSLLDTFKGYLAYYFASTTFIPLFNYLPWRENVVDNILLNAYDWEISEDATSTWRIGDGTAPFYNYIYYVMGGFSEHDTLRSNQIREGHITREKALELIENDNMPRWQSLKWYFDVINLNLHDVLMKVNNFSKFNLVAPNYMLGVLNGE